MIPDEFGRAIIAFQCSGLFLSFTKIFKWYFSIPCNLLLLCTSHFATGLDEMFMCEGLKERPHSGYGL